jgi:hypothetical protein
MSFWFVAAEMVDDVVDDGYLFIAHCRAIAT